MKSPLYMKTLHARLERDNLAVLCGMITNRAPFPSPPARLTFSLHDQSGKLVGRAAASLPEIHPYKTEAFETSVRLREDCFFTVNCRLEKTRDVDYSDFALAVHNWRGASQAAAGGFFGRKQK